MPTLPKIAPVPGFDAQMLDIGYYLEQPYDDVSSAAQELPSVMEWINELRQAYAENRDKTRIEIDRAEASAYFELRGSGENNFSSNYAGKVTEDALKMAVRLDPEVKRLNEQLSLQTSQVVRLTGTLASLQAKVELLRSSEATRRRVFDDTTPTD